MELLVVVFLLVVVGYAADRWGVDSRDDFVERLR
jgi:hypothetical protein